MADASKILLTEGDAPAAPAAGLAAAYVKTDHNLYTKGSDGVEHGAVGLSNVVEDLTPQLGGDLDAQSKKITALLSLDFTDFAEITIAIGAVTVTQTCHTVDTAADAASDDLDTINGGTNGMLLVIRAENDARSVVVKHNTGNIWSPGAADITLDDIRDACLLVYDGTKWIVIGWVSTAGAGDMLKTTYDPDADGVIAAAQLDAGILYKSTYNVHTVLAATADDTPAALTVTEQTVVGRETGGNIAALPIGITDNDIVQIDGADIADDEYARFTAAGLESRTKVEVATDLKDQFPQAITDNHVLTVDDAAAADDDFARFTASGIEGLAAQAAHTALLAAILAENDSLQLDAALSADGKYNGITRDGTAGATLAFGDLCYLAVADSRWELTDASAEATAKGLLGICVLAAAADASATRMLLYGIVRADTAFPALTIGAPVFMGEVAGDVVTTAPSTAASITRVVGQAWTADELLFCPSPDWFEHV